MEPGASCREALDAMFRGRHRLVVSSDWLREWNIKPTHFSVEWRAKMADGGLDVSVSNAPPEFRAALAGSVRASQRGELEKDAHLAWMASRTGKAILSMDKRIVPVLRLAATTVAEIRDIEWGNPEIPGDGVVAWLNDGAPVRDAYRLRPRASAKAQALAEQRALARDRRSS